MLMFRVLLQGKMYILLLLWKGQVSK